MLSSNIREEAEKVIAGIHLAISKIKILTWFIFASKEEKEITATTQALKRLENLLKDKDTTDTKIEIAFTNEKHNFRNTAYAVQLNSFLTYCQQQKKSIQAQPVEILKHISEFLDETSLAAAASSCSKLSIPMRLRNSLRLKRLHGNPRNYNCKNPTITVNTSANPVTVKAYLSTGKVAVGYKGGDIKIFDSKEAKCLASHKIRELPIRDIVVLTRKNEVNPEEYQGTSYLVCRSEAGLITILNPENLLDRMQFSASSLRYGAFRYEDVRILRDGSLACITGNVFDIYNPWDFLIFRNRAEYSIKSLRLGSYFIDRKLDNSYEVNVLLDGNYFVMTPGYFQNLDSDSRCEHIPEKLIIFDRSGKELFRTCIDSHETDVLHQFNNGKIGFFGSINKLLDRTFLTDMKSDCKQELPGVTFDNFRDHFDSPTNNIVELPYGYFAMVCRANKRNCKIYILSFNLKEYRSIFGTKGFEFKFNKINLNEDIKKLYASSNGELFALTVDDKEIRIVFPELKQEDLLQPELSPSFKKRM